MLHNDYFLVNEAFNTTTEMHGTVFLDFSDTFSVGSISVGRSASKYRSDKGRGTTFLFRTCRFGLHRIHERRLFCYCRPVANLINSFSDGKPVRPTDCTNSNFECNFLHTVKAFVPIFATARSARALYVLTSFCVVKDE